MGVPNRWVSLWPDGRPHNFDFWRDWAQLLSFGLGDSALQSQHIVGSRQNWCGWLVRPWAQGPVMLLQLAHFNLFLASIYDFQHCQTLFLISTCVLGVWEREERQAEQEARNRAAMSLWAGRNRVRIWLRVEGGMFNEIKMPPVGFQLSKAQTQKCGRTVLSVFYQQWRMPIADCTAKPKLGRTVGC